MKDHEVIICDGGTPSAVFPVATDDMSDAHASVVSLRDAGEKARHGRIIIVEGETLREDVDLDGLLSALDAGHDAVVTDLVPEAVEASYGCAEWLLRRLFGRPMGDLGRIVPGMPMAFQVGMFREAAASAAPGATGMDIMTAAFVAGADIGVVRGGSRLMKRSWIRQAYRMGCTMFRRRISARPLIPIVPASSGPGMIGAGVERGKERFVTHTTLPHDVSALTTFVGWQKVLIAIIVVSLVTGVTLSPFSTGIIIVAVLTASYFVDGAFQLFLVLRSLSSPPEMRFGKERLDALDETTLPVYSVLCPLYREANVLPAFISAMDSIDWPTDRLDIILLLEEDDQETIRTARAMALPAAFSIRVVPHSLPKTKPKACNYGLAFARGDYVVVYDAEDIPDPLQLKKAYLGFRDSDPAVRCLQAKLNYFNPDRNLLTRFFTAEYSLWFDIFLPGLQSVDAAIPLGGTSNHFRTADLRDLRGWDPFNVTEDCDLGIRLFKRGYKTAIIDSVTLEEANSRVGNWLRQRSRWIKGYMQTYLVHMRDPIRFVRENGWHALTFQLVVGGKVAFLFINPTLWLATISYFAFRPIVGPAIETLFPSQIFLFAAASLIVGNFLSLYYFMLGSVRHGHYGIVKYVFLMPLYWILLSAASFVALYQLIVKPHYWEKTRHGLDATQSEDGPAPSPRGIVSPWARFPEAAYRYLDRAVFAMGAVAASVAVWVSASGFSNVRSETFANMVQALSFVWLLATVLAAAFALLVMRETARRRRDADNGTSNIGMFASMMRDASTVSAVWLSLSLLSFSLFGWEGVLLFAVFALLPVSIVFSYGIAGYLSGSGSHVHAALILLTEAGVRLALSHAIVVAGYPEWSIVAVPFALVMSAFVAFRMLRSRHDTFGYWSLVRTDRLSPATAVGTMAVVSAVAIPLAVGSGFLPSIVGSGGYAHLSVITAPGNALLVLATLLLLFAMPAFLRAQERILPALLLRTQLMVVSAAIAVSVSFSLFTDPSSSVRIASSRYLVAMSLLAMTNVFSVYGLVKRRYAFPTIGLLVPAALLFGASGTLEATLQAALAGFTLTSAVFLIEPMHRFVVRAIRDFVGVFGERLPDRTRDRRAGSDILIFNWRDLRHEYAGGAEVYIEELARQWVRQGNRVTLFCGNDGHSPRSEIVEGVEIVRRGGFYLVYLWAFVYYAIRFRGRYDVVIDSENGIPFFTPLYVRKPRIVCLMHHVHQEVFRRSLPAPLSALARFLEKGVMPIVYRHVRFVTVSESSRDEMRGIGLGQAGIRVIHPGIRQAFPLSVEKSVVPTVLYLGRLKAYKSVDVLIRAFRFVADGCPDARLVIAGSGEEEPYLKRLAEALRFGPGQVTFLGRVSEDRKWELLRRAWVVVNPSFMEGWGIVVIEANACGTPVIASDIPGLRDSVRDADTGYLVRYGDAAAFADRIRAVIGDQALRETLGQNAARWAGRFDWNVSGRRFLDTILQRT